MASAEKVRQQRGDSGVFRLMSDAGLFRVFLVEVAVNQVAVFLFRGLDEPLDHVGLHPVVGIHAEDIRAPGQCDSRRPGRGDAPVFPLQEGHARLQCPEGAFQQGLQLLRAVIRAAVVHEDELRLRVGLPEDGTGAPVEELADVVKRDDNGYKRLHVQGGNCIPAAKIAKKIP